ncbi:hypothetical protein E4198_20945 [Streptomyces sp. RKND-216]|uniref:hypothetical protein n=1 Tax=Streptomyces sp. RKND-216 TaxID=2562581 RepID=UPI00109DAD4B|nr:hypothetical protein [Streptomyces sp. RKND-216]THA26801.1 hypothetical protein E4198_20945 [Streptomyces sp. RKND-216]
MSTQETPEGPRLRRRLTVASVATAVLLAGGGGAYWASNAAESDDDTSAAADSRENPPPLVLDSLGLSESGDTPERGIAPGEPNPNATVYEAEGDLPDGPGSAPVHRPEGDVTEAEMQAIADAFGVDGAPTEGDAGWRVGGTPDGSGPLLTVDEETGAWSFIRHRPTGDDLCGKPKEGGAGKPPAPCPDQQADGEGQSSSDGERGGDPVPADEAKKTVRPALEALDLDSAALDASHSYQDTRLVTAKPRPGGIPSQDWSSTFTVNSAGELVRGHGRLGELVKGAVYPVMTAEETLKALNKHRASAGMPEVPSCDDAPPPRPKDENTDLGGYPKADDVIRCATPGSEDSSASGGDATATVSGATFGLAAEYSKGAPILVPAWIYDVEKQGAEGTYQVAFPAVEREYLRTPEDKGSEDGSDTPVSPGSPDGRKLISYRADGRDLTVTFWGGVCHDYQAVAKPADGGVEVKVEPKNPEPKENCIMIAEKQKVTVQLDKPLDGRKVLDARSGDPLPKK